MTIRKTAIIALTLTLSLSILVATTSAGDCCDTFPLVICKQDFLQKNAAIRSPLEHCFGFPAKCYDGGKCTDFCMPIDFILNVTANDHYSATVTAIAMDGLLEDPAGMMIGKQYRAERRSPATPIYLQTLSFLC